MVRHVHDWSVLKGQIRVGDTLLKLNDQDVTGWTLDDIASNLSSVLNGSLPNRTLQVLRRRTTTTNVSSSSSSSSSNTKRRPSKQGRQDVVDVVDNTATDDLAAEIEEISEHDEPAPKRFRKSRTSKPREPYKVRDVSDKWRGTFELMTNFVTEHGHGYPRKIDNEDLWKFMKVVRKDYHGQRLNPNKQQLLESIGINLEDDPRMVSWMNYLEGCKQYKAKYGHLYIEPSKTPEYAKLHQWCQNMRGHYKRYRKGDMKASINEEKIRLVEEIDFPWSTQRTNWDHEWYEKYEQLKVRLKKKTSERHRSSK